jgi:hypothetical protein
MIPYPVSRTGKRVTLIACIAADGSFLPPGIVICWKTFDHEFLFHEFTSEKVEIYYGNKGYMNLQNFINWITDTFVPDMIARSQKWNYGGPAALILDNCSAHQD